MAAKTQTAPARIHLLAAKEAPYVVIIRRKPSRLAHIMRLNTQTDEIEHGSWFRGRIYEKRCDLSFDGQHMIYLAMGSHAETWNGVCQPPFLKTLVHWENTGTWYGGGLFRSENRLELNEVHSVEDARKAIADMETPLPFEVGFLTKPGHSEDEGVLYPRLERDGFARVGPMGTMSRGRSKNYSVICEDDPGWVKRPTPDHPELRLRYRGYFSEVGRDFEWDIPELPGLLDEEVSWAVYDSLGQLIVARQGVVYRYTLEDLHSRMPSAVFDFEDLVKPIRETRAEKKQKLPRIEFVTGNLADLEVNAIVLPVSNSLWVREIHELAGEHLKLHFEDWNPEVGDALRTPAYYLRQHDLIHLVEPAPSDGYEALRKACFRAFEAVGMGTDCSVALKPIGLEAGWTRKESESATVEAANRYVEEDSSRRVLILSD